MARNGVGSGACSFRADDRGARSPQEFDETVLEIMTGGDDGLDGGSPNDQYTFIPLENNDNKRLFGKTGRTTRRKHPR